MARLFGELDLKPCELLLSFAVGFKHLRIVLQSKTDERYSDRSKLTFNCKD